MPRSENHPARIMPTFGAKSDANQIASGSIFIASNRREKRFLIFCVRVAAEGNITKKVLARTFFRLAIDHERKKETRCTL